MRGEAQQQEEGGETMLALTFGGKQTIHLSTVPRPRLHSPGDVLVRVTLCSICGSDLHPFHCREEGLALGTVVGHEFTGVVEAVGEAVTQLTVGDRVMSPFTTSCGDCFYCCKGTTCRCSHAQGGACFGWVAAEGGAGLQGSQAQFVRVPLAEGTLVKVPEGVSEEQAILLGDILSTACFCVDQGGVGPGDTAVVLGCGPVGLLAVLAAQQQGAARVIAVDGVAARRAKAAELGGRGADVALELVGSAAALRLAFDLLRPAGVLSSIGVQTEPLLPFSPVECYNKNLTFRSGRCPARAYMARLLPRLQAGQLALATSVISHRLPLAHGVEGYRLFDTKQAIKVVLDPWAQ